MKIGMIFPGQGSQFVGMGKELYDRQRVIQDLFEQASHCLGKNFVQLCFASSERELMDTVNTQTSIFLVSAAIVTVLKEQYGIVPDVVAGHSLGEYSALFAAGGINFADALYLLRKRAEFMEEATKTQQGTMLAVLNTPRDTLERIVSEFDVADSSEQVAEIVNYNSPTQYVVSGTLQELDKVRTAVKEAGGKALPLKVSGAFHSRLMKDAQDKFARYLAKVDFHSLSMALINNVSARGIQVASDISDSLVRQISSPVLWWQSMQQFKDCDIILEIGPGNKLSKLLERQWPDKAIFSINDEKDIVRVASELGIDMPAATPNVEEDGHDDAN